MNAYLYIRLSSADRDMAEGGESESVSNQRALLRQYLKEHAELSPCEVTEFVDDGFSGTSGNRPAFERMIESLKGGGARLVLCKDLSRFFRDYVEIGEYLERVFPLLGVRLIAVNDGYDSDDYKGTTGGMDVVLKCIVNGFYSRDLSQKIRTVETAMARKGQYIGSYSPYGYLKDPADKHRLVLDAVAAPVVRRIFDLALEGKGTGEIAKLLNNDHVEPPAAHFHRLHPESKKFQKGTSALNSWTSISVLEILKRRTYTGALVSGQKDWKRVDSPRTTVKEESEWIVVPGCHEAIVTDDEFERAQAVVGKGGGRGARKKREYLLRGLVRCGVCGRAMIRHPAGKRRGAYYYCDRGRFIEDTPCPVDERFDEGKLEGIVLDSLGQLLKAVVDGDKRAREAAAKSLGTMENVRRSLLRAEQAVKKNASEKMAAYEQYADGKLSKDAYLARRDELAAEAARLNGERDDLGGRLKAMEQSRDSGATETAAAAREFLRAEDVTNDMLLNFVGSVKVFSGGRVEIDYRFRNPFSDERP